jgi:uncharacterized protein with HEPN domain
MARELKLIFQDILETIDVARETCLGIGRDEFYANRVRFLAAQRALEIISEASRHLPDEILARHPRQPWPQIKAYGNFVRHEYFRIDDWTIWDAIQSSLPSLEAVILEEQARLQRPAEDSDG